MNWSRKYEHCLECLTTKIKHNAKGLCKRCYLRKYSKTDQARISQRKYKTGTRKETRKLRRYVKNLGRKKGKWANLAKQGKLLKIRNENTGELVSTPFKPGDLEVYGGLHKLNKFRNILKTYEKY